MFDTSLIISWVIGLQASTCIKTLLLYELAPVPTYMFSDSGDLRISKAKSELKKQFQSVISVRLTEKESTCSILDGSAILYVVHCPDKDVLNEYLIKYYVYYYT